MHSTHQLEHASPLVSLYGFDFPIPMIVGYIPIKSHETLIKSYLKIHIMGYGPYPIKSQIIPYNSPIIPLNPCIPSDHALFLSMSIPWVVMSTALRALHACALPRLTNDKQPLGFVLKWGFPQVTIGESMLKCNAKSWSNDLGDLGLAYFRTPSFGVWKNFMLNGVMMNPGFRDPLAQTNRRLMVKGPNIGEYYYSSLAKGIFLS